MSKFTKTDRINFFVKQIENGANEKTAIEMTIAEFGVSRSTVKRDTKNIEVVEETTTANTTPEFDDSAEACAEVEAENKHMEDVINASKKDKPAKAKKGKAEPKAKKATQADIINGMMRDGIDRAEMAQELSDTCHKDLKWAKARINLHFSYINNGGHAGRKAKTSAAKMVQTDLFNN